MSSRVIIGWGGGGTSRMRRFVSAVLLGGVCGWAGTAEAVTTPIDLNDFFFFAGDQVTVAADGSSATIAEHLDFSPIILSNDPTKGDTPVIFPGPGVELVFDFDFVEGPAVDEDDEFGAFIIDPVTGSSVGAGFEFFTTDTSAGTVSFDLTLLAGTVDLGLQFQLSALFGDLGLESTLTISNVRLEAPDVAPRVIPEPLSATLGLVGVGALGLSTRRRRA